MPVTAARIGQLTCRIVDEGAAAPPPLTVVLCHGYGAPGTDLVGLGAEVLRARPRLRAAVRFVFPEAPLALDDGMAGGPGGGRAWWPLDWERLERAARDPAERARLQEETPAGMPLARKLVRGVVDELVATSGRPTSSILLGGFSQGAMVTTDVALRLDEAPAGLAVFSGTVLCRDEWRRLAQRRAGLPVVVSHGRVDPLLPFAAAEQLVALLQDAGLDATFAPFHGPHTIGPEGFAAFVALVERLA